MPRTGIPGGHRTIAFSLPSHVAREIEKVPAGRRSMVASEILMSQVGRFGMDPEVGYEVQLQYILARVIPVLRREVALAVWDMREMSLEEMRGYAVERGKDVQRSEPPMRAMHIGKREMPGDYQGVYEPDEGGNAHE